jgi:hypothetical protein
MIIKSFYSTVVMNVITWNKAFALFPRTTFLRHNAYPLTVVTDYYAKLHAKYTRRGWAMRTLPPETETPRELIDYRRIGDRMSWQMSLDTQSVVRAEQPDYVVEYSQFNVTSGYSSDRGTWGALHYAAVFTIEAQIWTSNVLRYKYTFINTELMREFGARMDYSTLSQLAMLGGSRRIELIGNREVIEFCPWKLEFEKPDGWEYLDEEYVRCIDESTRKRKRSRTFLARD